MPHLRVAAYVKLAKLWEKSRHDALAYQNQYYQMKFADNPNMQLVGVYVDITGKKEIRNRPEMLRLLRDCTSGKIDCIATQTQAYLAANSKEFFYLMKFVLELSPPIEIITEDSNYSFNTITDMDHQREALLNTANKYVGLSPSTYEMWKSSIEEGMKKLLL